MAAINSYHPRAVSVDPHGPSNPNPNPNPDPDPSERPTTTNTSTDGDLNQTEHIIPTNNSNRASNFTTAIFNPSPLSQSLSSLNSATLSLLPQGPTQLEFWALEMKRHEYIAYRLSST